MKKNTPKPPKIHIGKTGGVWVDAEEFFAQPEVQKQIKKMKEMNIVGMKLDGKHLSANNNKSSKKPE